MSSAPCSSSVTSRDELITPSTPPGGTSQNDELLEGCRSKAPSAHLEAVQNHAPSRSVDGSRSPVRFQSSPRPTSSRSWEDGTPMGRHESRFRVAAFALNAVRRMSIRGLNGNSELPEGPQYPFWLIRGARDGGPNAPGTPLLRDNSMMLSPTPETPKTGNRSADQLDSPYNSGQFPQTTVHDGGATPSAKGLGRSLERKMVDKLDEIKNKVEKRKPAKRFLYIHDENQRLQLEQVTWKSLMDNLAAGARLKEAKEVKDDTVREEKMREARESIQGAEESFLALLEQRPNSSDSTHFRAVLSGEDMPFKYAYSYGPCGDLPMHTCFLLGLKDLGMKVIERYYDTPGKISLPYADDTKFWSTEHLRGSGRHKIVLDDEKCIQYYDGGLFTGETVLHIAIVQHKDPELVQWMLDRGCNVVARATGAFFKPKHIKAQAQEKRSDRMKKYKFIQRRIKDYFQARPLRTLEEANDAKRIQNDVSACDYGELPLSFAVSVGNLEICVRLLDHATKSQERDKGWLAFVNQTKEKLDAQHVIFDRRTKVQEIKKEFDKEWNELHFGDPMEEDSEDRIRKEYMDLKMKEAQFYFVNACVNNGAGEKGNTALHMAVLHRQTHIIEWLMNNGAAPSLQILNEDDLTPFTLAARHGSVDIFYIFLTMYMRETAWKYGEVQMSRMSLEQLDSFRMGHPTDFEDAEKTVPKPWPLHSDKWRSAIEVIVEHEVDVFSNDPLFNKLIIDKWNKFGRQMYLERTLIPYMCVLFMGIVLALFCAYMFLRCHEINNSWSRWMNDGIVLVGSGEEEPLFKRIREGTSGPEDIYGILSFVIQVILVCPAAFPWLINKGWRQRRLRGRDLDANRDGQWDIQGFLFKNLAFLLDVSTSIMLVATFGLRITRQYGAELDCLAITSVLMWSNLLSLIMPFKFFGIMAITTYKMLVGDVIRFLMVFVITTMAFAFSMTCLFQKSQDPDEIADMDIPGTSVIGLIYIAVGEVNTYDMIANSRNVYLTFVVHVVYCILQTILMLNLLIAMMAKTFNLSMDDTHKTWIFPFANLVLRYERLMPPKHANLAKNRCGEADRADAAAMSGLDVKRAKFFVVEVGVDQREKAEKENLASQTRRHWSVIERVQGRLTDCVADVSAAIKEISDVVYRQNRRSLTPPPGDSFEDVQIADRDTAWLERQVLLLESHVSALKTQRADSKRSSPKRTKPWYNNPRLTPLPAITPHIDPPLDDSSRMLEWGAETPVG